MNLQKFTILLFLVLNYCLEIAAAPTEIYWIQKTGGNFDDPDNWSLTSGGNGGQAIPTSETVAVFDENSSLIDGAIVVFEPGESYHVSSLIVQGSTEPFFLQFKGSSNNPTVLSIHDELFLTGPVQTSFVNSGFANRILMVDGDANSSIREIHTEGKDLNYLEIQKPGVTYRLKSDLYASSFIRFYGGTWDLKGYDVTTDGEILFRDNQSSSNAFEKIVLANGSTINAFKLSAKLAYDLTMTGNYTISANIFEGSSPINANDPVKLYSNIVLLDYEPGTAPGSILFDNNYECVRCRMKSVTIEDDGVTQIGGGSIIETLTIINSTSIIHINDGNSLPSWIKLNQVNTPAITDICRQMPIIRPRSDLSNIVVDTIGGFNGDIEISRAMIERLPAGDGDDYTLTQGILGGGATGWNTDGPFSSRTFVWNKGINDNSWFSPENWIELSGVTGCIPTANDHVYITDDSAGPINIPSNTKPVCKDFIWTKEEDLLILEMNSSIEVFGDLTVGDEAHFTGSRYFLLRGAGTQLLEAHSSMPPIHISAPGTNINLKEDLECESLVFNGGTFATGGNDVVTNSWFGDNIKTNNFFFGNSTITVNGEFSLGLNNGNEMTVDAGTSHIICEDFFSPYHYGFYDLTLTNAATFSFVLWEYSFNDLTLGGVGKVIMPEDMEVNRLILEDGDSELEFGSGIVLTVADEVIAESGATNSNPASIKSIFNSNPGQIIKTQGNLCMSGHIDFEDITAQTEGVVHAPLGNDIGANSGINFTPISFDQSIPLYWVGETPDWPFRFNWSTVSGGCSTNFNPNRPLLIFDEHSFYDHNEVVLAAVTNANNLLFENFDDEFTVDIRVRLNTADVDFKNAYVKLIGMDLLSEGTTTSEGSILDFDGRLYRTKTLNFENNPSLMILRQNRELRVEQ